jgi:hypothetical protein
LAAAGFDKKWIEIDGLTPRVAEGLKDKKDQFKLTASANHYDISCLSQSEQ